MIINANALSIPLADKSVHMIVTSPPYWGLRDYGTAKWEGGEPGCDHKPNSTQGATGQRADRTFTAVKPFSVICGKCGAIRIDNQLGLERTPDEYIAKMVAVFRECWRVLRDDGTCWVNLGDCYWHTESSDRASRGDYTNQDVGAWGKRADTGNSRAGKVANVKPKDLVGIPWRLAFALQADGWYLRSDIIWNKPNPMPESVTDRPTKSHEYLFLLAKRERYYYDNEAIREDFTDERMGNPGKYNKTSSEERKANNDRQDLGFINNGGGWERGEILGGRNRRTVWTIPTAPYKGAHFATFPPALVEPCIKAGTSERGVCPKCGKGWKRVVDVKQIKLDNREMSGRITGGTSMDSGAGNKNGGFHELPRTRKESNTLGWQPACTCGQNNGGPLEPIPAIVFDPFVGSGTTVKVAYDLGRRGVGLDLSLEYLSEQATTRIHNGHTGRLL